jgi:hypothetical protein
MTNSTTTPSNINSGRDILAMDVGRVVAVSVAG